MADVVAVDGVLNVAVCGFVVVAVTNCKFGSVAVENLALRL